MTILDLENWSAQGAVAELRRKVLTVRLSFDLRGAPNIKLIATADGGNMNPDLMVIEYSKQNDEPWRVTNLRVYGKPIYTTDPFVDGFGIEEYRPTVVVNVYNHDNINTTTVPAWIRDAAISGMPA